MKRSTAKKRDAGDGNSIWLPAETIRHLEELSQRNGSHTIEAVVEEAARLFGRFKTTPELEAYANLSPRLREVLRMIAEGRSTKEIATQLKVSKKTVEFHRSQLVKKLGIRAVALITRYAVRVGAVHP